MSMPSAGTARTWRRELVVVALWLALCTLTGLMVGYALLALLFGVSAYLAVHLTYAYQLHRWLASDRIEPSEGMGVWQEIYTELYRLKQRNRKRKKRLKSIVHEFQASTAALPDGAVVLDSQGRIVWFNEAAGALMALRSPQDLGQRLANLLRHPRVSSHLIKAEHIGELEVPSPVNEEDTLLLRLIPYGNNQRLLIARDISEQKRLEHTRRDFVANASHELRTPLTVLRGYLEMMEEEAGSDGALAGWQAPIREMGEQSRRMNRIIESLLKLARLESEGLQQRQERIDIPKMIQSLVDDIRRANSTSHEIVMDIEPGLDLYGRPGELESVFSNLLSNAVRYTTGDAGTIHVRWWREDEAACFSVTDNGPGIEASHLPRLTERFYRVDPGRQASSGGTGLGLAIVKHCLEHHEAELHIDSEPGVGSTFTCRFPVQRALERQAA
ncbi:phosphate regulon sensor histidine kinase PhoR [Salinisphaera sp.]|uniref:phosphate regulon sensor histidine kinase PhoR n=1 Tax=Salinisphaera sp. TaxID=1914330 RepID=UPI000C4FC33E|nr:phosphate regulon sensor histidine kinase PhoR [Salinisphaera sp.]MBS62812.1 phosphate regulon sensor histidine kinase PhoR [Salinisphaera sp.]